MSEFLEDQKPLVTGDAAALKLPRKPRKKRKACCFLCKWGFLYADYKDVEFLKKRYLKNNKIVSHKVSGNCMKHQHQIATAIKRARMVGLLPFVEE